MITTLQHNNNNKQITILKQHNNNNTTTNYNLIERISRAESNFVTRTQKAQNLLESMKVKVYVNIINKCTIGTVNIIYLMLR